MPDASAIQWTPSSNLPKKPASFVGVTYQEMMDRARALAPTLAGRAQACEQLRRMPDETPLNPHHIQQASRRLISPLPIRA